VSTAVFLFITGSENKVSYLPFIKKKSLSERADRK